MKNRRSCQLVEIETGKTVEVSPVSLDSLDYDFTEQEHEDAVWQKAVDEELVHKNFRHKYRFVYTKS